MALARRIRSLKLNRKNKASSTADDCQQSPRESVEVIYDGPLLDDGYDFDDDDEIDRDLPMKEVTIDLSQQDTYVNVISDSYSLRYQELQSGNSTWKTCNCGLEANDGILCLTDGLCGVISSPIAIMDVKPPDKKSLQYPIFIKVDKVDRNKSVTPPCGGGSACSILPAVSDLEVENIVQSRQVQKEQNHKHQKDELNLNDSERTRVLQGTVNSLHLHVRPIQTKKNQADKMQSQTEQDKDKLGEGNISPPENSVERIRLPIRAGKHKPHENADGIEHRAQNASLDTNKARRLQLPIRAGRVSRFQETHEPILERTAPRKSLAERRRCMIAVSKKQEPPISPNPKRYINYIPFIDVSHNMSFEYDEELETTMQNSRDEDGNEVCKDKMCRGQSPTTINTTKGSLDYTTASSHETLEETLEETFECSFDSDQSNQKYDKEAIETAGDRNTKAGWITRQLFREGRRDTVDGAQCVELVYTSVE